MSYYQIPVDSSPNQEFDITVPVDGNNLQLHLSFTYNTIANYWVMSVADKNKNMLVMSIPLVTGTNLVGQYNHLALGSAFLVKTGDSALNYPDSDSLGNEFILLWGDTVV
jgi:predicted Zn-dependent protease with MMP-like domain